MSDSRAPDEDEVRTLLEQCVAAWHEGGPRAADALLLAAPELARRVREGLAALARGGLLDDEGAPLPERIGGYRVLGLLGRGGMGAVFRAHDDTADREVAVKVVHPQLLWYGRARERFEREIRALGRLTHRGAVSIYHFGEDCGVPFFVMEFVPGRSLAAILARVAGRDPNGLVAADLQDGPADPAGAYADREPWWRAVVAIVAQVADTLQHAHRLGIVHRDVKPSNLLVTPAGEARLVDFGLARLDDDAALTRVPTTIGSDPYMAPEQTSERGGRADARSDVFSLGATLYEALCLVPPYGSGGSRTRERMRAGDHAPVRSIARRLPRDLDAVCAVALDPEPARRYATAAAFADDLRAVIVGAPVAARPLGLFGRAWRLARRHRVATAASATALLALIAGPTVIALQQYRTSAEREVALAKSERGLQHALEAIDRLLARVAQERLFALPEAEGARRHLLEDAVAMQETILREQGGDPRVAAHVAAGKRRLGELQAWLGDAVNAERCNDEALAILETLPPGSEAELARALANRALVANKRRDHAACRADLSRAIEVLDGAVARASTPAASATLRRLAAERRVDLAIAEATLGNLAGADEMLAQALEMLSPLPAEPHTLAARGRTFAHGLKVAAQRGAPALAARLGAAAVDCYSRALEFDPEDWELAAARAMARADLGKLAQQCRDAGDALEHATAAHDALSAVHERHPQVGWVTTQLVSADLGLADALRAHAREDEARRVLDAAIGILRECKRADAAAPATRELLALALGSRAEITTYVHEAGPLLEEAQQLLDDLLSERPESPTLWRQAAVVLASRASLLRTSGDLEGEASLLDEALVVVGPRAETKLPPAVAILTTLRLDRADCAARAGDAALARKLLDAARLDGKVSRADVASRAGLASLLSTPAFADVFR